MRRIRAIFIGAAVLAALSPLSADSAALIYVYATWNSPARSWVPIVCDDVVAAQLKRGRFFALRLAPGRHWLSQGDSVPLFVNAQAGEESFVRLDQHVELGPSPRTAIPWLQLVSPADARKEVIHLAYIDPDKMSSVLVSRKDPTRLWQPQLKTRDDQ